MYSKKCVVKLGVKDLTIYVLMWLKIRTKVNIAFSLKVKTHILNALREWSFLFFKYCFQSKIGMTLGKLDEMVSLQNQIEELWVQDKLGQQNFHEDMKKLNEALNDTIKNNSKNITKCMTETSMKINNPIWFSPKKFWNRWMIKVW